MTTLNIKKTNTGDGQIAIVLADQEENSLYFIRSILKEAIDNVHFVDGPVCPSVEGNATISMVSRRAYIRLSDSHIKKRDGMTTMSNHVLHTILEKLVDSIKEEVVDHPEKKHLYLYQIVISPQIEDERIPAISYRVTFRYNTSEC